MKRLSKLHLMIIFVVLAIGLGIYRYTVFPDIAMDISILCFGVYGLGILGGIILRMQSSTKNR